VASIRHEIEIAARQEDVWSAIRDVGAVHRRLLPGRLAGARIDGDTRTLTFADGRMVRELIVDVDDDARRLAYAVVGTRSPLTHHHATMQVFPEGADHSLLVWVTDLLPDSRAADARSRIEVGAAEMKRALEAG
jgi:hypothetical protein